MTYLIGLLLLALIGCAVTIYRLSGDINDLRGENQVIGMNSHYLRKRNEELNAELLRHDVTHTASTSYREDGENRSIVVFPPETKTLPATHPQKRVRSIRGKRK